MIIFVFRCGEEKDLAQESRKQRSRATIIRSDEQIIYNIQRSQKASILSPAPYHIICRLMDVKELCDNLQLFYKFIGFPNSVTLQLEELPCDLSWPVSWL
jgi:quinolinate synthase